MKKILLIAYFYPPLGGAGTFRPLKFSKYLPKFGWKPYVITVKNSGVYSKDPSLMQDLPKGIRIERTYRIPIDLFSPIVKKTLGNYKVVYIPDLFIGWLLHTVSKGLQIIKRENVDVIFATAPPFTSLIIGCILKFFTGKPLISDYRDLWVDNEAIRPPTKFHESLERRLEKFVLNHSNIVITVSEGMKSLLCKNYELDPKKIIVIMNGYDPADFKNIKSIPEQKLRFTSIGSLYGLRRVDNFAKAFSRLLDKNPDLRTRVSLTFMGNIVKKHLECINKNNLDDVAEILPYSPHKDAISLIKNSDVLLIVIGQGNHIYTGKLFEYLYAKKFILMLADECAAANLIKRLHVGLTVPPDDVRKIEKALEEIIIKWRNKELKTKLKYAQIKEFNRVNLTQKLVKLLDTLVLHDP